eukprot:2655823-Amphidinium_carterae.4
MSGCISNGLGTCRMNTQTTPGQHCSAREQKGPVLVKRESTTMTACMNSLETLWQEVQRRRMPSCFGVLPPRSRCCNVWRGFTLAW